MNMNNTHDQNNLNNMFDLSLSSLKDILDVNIIIGDKIEISETTYLIPVSKLKVSFASGGTERRKIKTADTKYPFGGGIGSSVSINPECFIFVSDGNAQILHVNESSNDYLDLFVNTFKKVVNKESPIS